MDKWGSGMKSDKGTTCKTRAVIAPKADTDACDNVERYAPNGFVIVATGEGVIKKADGSSPLQVSFKLFQEATFDFSEEH